MVPGDSMDRNNITKIAQSDEDKILLARIWDKINAGMQRNILAATGFLSPREQVLCQYLFGDTPGLCYLGGYQDAERKMLVYLPDYLEEHDAPIHCLRATFYEGDSPSHRDFLGALMGAGIDRSAVGDICIGTGTCDFLVTAQMVPYLLQNLTSAGRTHLHLEEISLDRLQVPQAQFQEIRDTLASLRLDSAVAAGFRMGRSQASQSILSGKVAIDGLPCEKPDRPVSEGAKISLRGAGKIKLASVGAQTKKGRISVVIHRYV